MATDGRPSAAGIAPHGRAGRDLRAATLVGAALGVLVVAGLWWQPGFVAVVTIAAVIAVWELAHALGERGIRVPLVPVVLGAVLMIVAGYVGDRKSVV